MKKLALGLIVGLAAACGGGDGVTLMPDAPPVPMVCNPIAQTGCEAGEKCTWIIDQEEPEVGHIGCVQDGTVATDGACAFGAAGATGFDDCVAGNICVANECKEICDPQQSGVATGCDAQHSCSRYSGLFESGGMITAGACDPQCDPLNQNLLAGAGVTAACGSTNPAMPNKGCYTFNFTEFSCAPVNATTLTKTDRVDPVRDTVSGDPFVNGCAPGYVPLFFESGTVQETRCSGSCAVGEIDDASAGHIANDTGVDAATAKLVTAAAPAVGDGLCTAGKKGSATGGVQNCVFLWSIFQDPPNGQFDETLGFCIAFTQFQFDSNGDMTPDTVLPNCNTRPQRNKGGATRDQLTPGPADDAADLGCQLKVNSMLNGQPKATAIQRMVRPSFGTGKALRHQF
jgi:hypothetical protein